MDSSREDLLCLQCNLPYDEANRQPRILNNCGHTICLSCLHQAFKAFQLDQSYTLQCPDHSCDEPSISLLHLKVSNFPRNMVLLKMLQKANLNSNSNANININKSQNISQL